ncbi:hypothetical protein ABKN59_011717 [Abortiporus biennis]
MLKAFCYFFWVRLNNLLHQFLCRPKLKVLLKGKNIWIAAPSAHRAVAEDWTGTTYGKKNIEEEEIFYLCIRGYTGYFMFVISRGNTGTLPF